MSNFIGRYLGPLFAQEHPEVDLYFGTFNCNRMADLDCVMQDTAAARYVRGIGLQWEGKDIVGEIHDKYPEMQLMRKTSVEAVLSIGRLPNIPLI